MVEDSGIPGEKPPPPPPSGWQPPPRPPELRDVHVVDLNAERTDGIDYFALISDRKREIERTRQERLERGREDSSRSSRANRGGRAEEPAAKLQSTAQTPSQRTRTGAESPAAGAPLTAAQASDTAEIAPGQIFSFPERTRVFLRAHKTVLTLAAGLGAVFVLTYGVVVSLTPKGRDVAATPATGEPTPRAAALSEGQAPASAAVPSDLGKGTNRVSRGGGGVSRSATPPSPRGAGGTVVPAMPNPPLAAPSPPTPEPPREPPQFYSSSEDVANPQPPQENPPSNPAAPDPNAAHPGSDPNSGVVQPPAMNHGIDPTTGGGSY